MNDEGRVLFLNAISALNGSYYPVYTFSKVAVVCFLKSMTKHGPKKIRFNAVAHG
jgi:NAD(P)-dependent dehydrogenase (short-subunit alcohol dehydrogenase family)